MECSIVRVGDAFRDQVAETGHDARLGDLDLIAGLGIRTLRYPVLWEAVAPPDAPLRGWDWHDRRLGRLRDLGIRPIVGLIHHGSGPPGTDLLDPNFAAGLAAHARRVAERYPWIDAYTPVNEPLTTARFSCLYGHWYPHRRGVPDFLRALVHQCRAVIASMASIREVAPAAELVQTEDIGRVFATDCLADQAAHENERRWLSLDLLFGRVRPGHAWWDPCREAGIAAADLEAFRDAPGPDLIGVNHYLTSDRYLDPDRGAYPEHLWGGNGRRAYADAEAVRIPGLDGVVGLAARLREVAARYPRPIAVTELHHGCTRDEQLRWLRDGWADACAVRSEGIDLRGVTVWSLFGAVDWNSLLTARQGHYEPGAFDVRGAMPRPTALAAATASLVRTGRLDGAGGSGPGWWRRPERCYGAGLQPEAGDGTAGPSLVLVGEEGALAEACRAVCRARGWTMRLADPRDGRLLAPAPDAVIDASAAGTDRDGGEPPAGHLDVGDLDVGDLDVGDLDVGDLDVGDLDFGDLDFGDLDVGDLDGRASEAARAGVPYAFLSNAAVFAVPTGAARLEADAANAANAWGARLAEAEAMLRRRHPGAIVLRTGILFGPESDDEIALRGPVAAGPDDAAAGSGTHSYLPDLLHAALDLLIDRENGVRHLVNPGLPATRTALVRLATSKGCLMPPLPNAVARHRAATAARRAERPLLQAAE